MIESSPASPSTTTINASSPRHACDHRKKYVFGMLLRNCGDSVKSEDITRYAENSGNEKVVAMVARFARKRERERGKREQKSEMSRWWQVWNSGS
jgi:hypothetical protein